MTRIKIVVVFVVFVAHGDLESFYSGRFLSFGLLRLSLLSQGLGGRKFQLFGLTILDLDGEIFLLRLVFSVVFRIG